MRPPIGVPGPTWQTVSIAWSELDRPTWGATASFLSVAETKLQAIDWGVSSATTAFEIQIDDVEMY